MRVPALCIYRQLSLYDGCLCILESGPIEIRSFLLFCEKFFHLFVDVLPREAELLVQHFVRSGEAEALHAIDAALGADANKPLKGARQAGCHAELLHVVGQDVLR